jgi:uncharacterized protein with FMN-binding domain
MSQQNKAKIIGLIVVVLLSTAATTGVVLVKNAGNVSGISLPNISSGSSTPVTATTAGSTTSATTTGSSTSSTTYKDGTYTAQGSFDTPNGTEQIGVTIKLTSNNITSVSIDDSSIYSGTSFAYTERFINGVNSVVVGQNIDTVSVGRISGASLTPIGFNTALDAIKNQAKA